MSAPVDERRKRLTLAAEQLDLPIEGSAADRLLCHLDLLQRWNGVYNLTSVRNPQDLLPQHLFDCLAVINPLWRQRGRQPQRVLDVGSGAGLPGVVIAVMCPWAEVTCVDAVGKKAAFLQQAVSELRLPNLRAVHGRVENITGLVYDVITSRAFASLADFTYLSQAQLAPSGVWMAMKAKQPLGEIDELNPEITVFHVEHLQVPELDAERCLVWMRKRA